MRGKVSFEQLWQELVETNFQKSNKDQQSVNFGDVKRYAEEKVDNMRKQKDEELEHYKKEIERAKRFENQKMAGGGANGGVGSEKLVVKKVVGRTAGGPVQRVKVNRAQ